MRLKYMYVNEDIISINQVFTLEPSDQHGCSLLIGQSTHTYALLG